VSLELQAIELAGQGASVTEIAAELGLEPAAVEFALARNGMMKEDEIGDDDFNAIRDGLLDLAKYSENEVVRAKVGMFLYERKKGPTAALKNAPTVNIGSLNLLIASSHERILRTLNNGQRGGASGTSEEPPSEVSAKGESEANSAADRTKA
jgi:hypothetical protein